MMRKILVVAATFALAIGAGAAQAHDAATQRADWLGERLELSDEQKAQVSEIFSGAQEQRQPLREQAREERKAAIEQRQARWRQIRSINEETQEQLAAVLTEEQSARLSDMREGMRERAIMRRGDRGRDFRRGMRHGRDLPRRMMRYRDRNEQTESPAADE